MKPTKEEFEIYDFFTAFAYLLDLSRTWTGVPGPAGTSPESNPILFHQISKISLQFEQLFEL